MIDLPSPKDLLQMIVAARIAKRAVALDDLSAVANVPRDELAQAIASLAVVQRSRNVVRSRP